MDPRRKRTACTDWKGAALTLMPPVWEGLETGGKAEDREHGAGGCSDDRDIEAWGGRKEGIQKARKQELRRGQLERLDL